MKAAAMKAIASTLIATASLLFAACGSTVGDDPSTGAAGVGASAEVAPQSAPSESIPDPVTTDPVPTDTSNPAEAANTVTEAPKISSDAAPAELPNGHQVITLGAGCFWCIEAVLEQVDGIQEVVSGYMGGHVDNPTYEQVCSKTTGHVEVVQITFDPKKLPLEHVLEWFWKLHDPTTKDRQGNDVGPQYRSAIFYHSAEQRAAAEKSMASAQSSFAAPIVTEIYPAARLWVAEEYHQDYYSQNKRAGYCRFVIAPKLDKLGLEK